MTNKNIFIHPTYKNRMSEDLKNYMMKMINNNEDYYPIAYSANRRGYHVYYINVNTTSNNFNRMYFLYYDPRYDPYPIVNIEDQQVHQSNNPNYEFPIPKIKELFICHDIEDFTLKQIYEIEEYGG